MTAVRTEWSGPGWSVDIGRRGWLRDSPRVAVTCGDYATGPEALTLDDATALFQALGQAIAQLAYAPDKVPPLPPAPLPGEVPLPLGTSPALKRTMRSMVEQATIADRLLRSHPAAGGPTVYLEGAPLCPGPLEQSPRRDEPRIGPAAQS